MYRKWFSYTYICIRCFSNSLIHWKFLKHSFNFSPCDWYVHIFYFFLVQSWEIVPFSELVHFFYVVPFIGIWLLVAPYDPLYFSGIHRNFSIFISKFIDLSPFPFSPWWIWLRFIHFVYLFKDAEKALGFTELFYFLCLSFMYFCSNLYDLFCWLWVLFFS